MSRLPSIPLESAIYDPVTMTIRTASITPGDTVDARTSANIFKVLLAGDTHPALGNELTDTLLEMANSPLDHERLFAVRHKAMPLSQVVMMLGDKNPEVRKSAEIIVEASK